MIMENIKFEIISEDVVTPELLLDYWKFGEKRRFELTIKDMLEKYNIQTPSILAKDVGKIGFLQVSRLKDCCKCYDKRKFHVRSDFNYFIDRVKSSDNKCIECLNKKNIKIAQEIFHYYKENYISSKPKLVQDKELSYLEKIHMFLLIINYLDTKKINWSALYTLKGYFCKNIVENLIKKGFIYNQESHYRLNLKQAKLRQIYWHDKSVFDSCFKEEICNFLKINFDHHSVLVIPSGYESIDDWVVELFKEIKEHKLSLSDIKDIEKFLFDMRFSEIYTLAEFVCESNKIPLSKDNALEFEFIRVTDKYNLEQIYNIFNYQATYTTSILYKISATQNNSLIINKDKIFTKNISYFITRMDQKSSDQHYSKPLPMSWEYSEFEQFISAHIIGGAEKWDRLTPKQILSRWLNVVEYHIEE